MFVQADKPREQVLQEPNTGSKQELNTEVL